VLDVVVNILAGGNVLADLQHPVLQGEKFAECVVEEGRGEGDVGG
jgi:hypothetical protein